MPRGSQFRRAPVRAPQRRKMTWAGSVRDTVYTTLAANTVVIDQVLDPKILGNVAAQESTIIRVRGILSIRSDQAAATEAQLGAMGMIMVTDAAVGVGASAVPSPVTDSNNDGWFVWVPFGQDGDQGAGGIGGAKSYVIDSKAMRKFDAGLQLVVVLENQHATAGLQFFSSFRVLVKLA